MHLSTRCTSKHTLDVRYIKLIETSVSEPHSSQLTAEYVQVTVQFTMVFGINSTSNSMRQTII